MKDITIRLTPSSSAEDILKASPEERRRLAEDIARQSNAFATSEICRELYEELCRELYQENKKIKRILYEPFSKKKTNLNLSLSLKSQQRML